jgi:hypothetical protein
LVPVSRSRTKTSRIKLVSPGTMLFEALSKATKRPSALMSGEFAPVSDSPPSWARLTSVSVPARRSNR